MCADFLYVIIHVVTKQLHGVLHTGLSLISGFGRDAPEVVSSHKRCAFYIICIHAWSESEDTICLSLVKSEQSVWKFAGRNE